MADSKRQHGGARSTDSDTAKSRPLLLTPGPLTTSEQTKRAMLRDWGSRDEAFIALTARVCRRLLSVVGAADQFACVPIQGSGTFAVEAMLGTLVPAAGKLLVAANGAYGRRMALIGEKLGRAVRVVATPEAEPVRPSLIEQALNDDPAISHVAVVHCETTTGLLNPIAEIARVIAAQDRALLIDAMSSFGGLPLSAATMPFQAIAASANKCLEGVPGVGFVIARRAALESATDTAPSLSLDLADQWQGLKANGQWRFTPPTHVVAALDAALDQLDAEGGVEGRRRRYETNCQRLIAGMRAAGFVPLLEQDIQAPIIVTFRRPRDPAYEFERFYGALGRRGIAIYPGKLTDRETFRIGCIGDITTADIDRAVAAVGAAMAELGMQSGAP